MIAIPLHSITSEVPTVCKLLPFLLLSLFLSACNLRENALLPPNLDPKDYVEASTILVYSDHLIKSENDASYLYIPKESIADAALNYGDRISFHRAEALLERDSLAFETDARAFTSTYQIDIIRSGESILLDSIPGFATLYTDMESPASLNDAALVQSAWVLDNSSVNVYPYGSGRCFFDLDGNGDLALMDLGHSDTLELEASGKATQALISRPGGDIHIWFPGDYLSSQLTLSVSDSLSSADLSLTQGLFEGFGLGTPVLSVQTNYQGAAVPILKIESGGKGVFATQWTRITDGRVQGWPSGEDTWLYEGNTLISFLQGNGRYFLLTPMATQDQITLPLDGTFEQLYLQDLWLDLNDLNLPNHNLSIDLQPQTQDLIAAYFTGAPFQIGNAWQAFAVTLKEGSATIASLPDDLWLELGLRAKHSNWAESRLTRVFRTASQDLISYKSYGDAYDEQHFSQSNGFVYSGIAASGTYLLAPISESTSSLNVPCLKPQVYIQTQRLELSWEDSSLPCSSLSFQFDATQPLGHPWLNGYPYTLSNRKSIMKIEALGRKRAVDTLPEGLFLRHRMNVAPQEVVNFNHSSTFPQWYRYRSVSAFEHNGFVMDGKILQISPAVPGYIFNAANLSHSGTSYGLMSYARMSWDERGYEVLLDSSTAMPSNSILEITPRTGFTDRLNILASQYQLSLLAPVYAFHMSGNSTFYNDFQPLIRLRQSSRRANHLFSITDGAYYRIFTYDQATQADGWHFGLSDGHVSFYLAYDGEFGAASDQDPHSSVEVTALSNANPLIASLYQAQADIPAQLIGAGMPLGARMILSEAINPPANAIGAQRVDFRTAQGAILNPNFYNVALEVPVPYVYMPIDNYSPGMELRMFYRDLSGTVTEFTRVQSFSADPVDEFIVAGNCAVCFINNSGLFYLTP